MSRQGASPQVALNEVSQFPGFGKAMKLLVSGATRSRVVFDGNAGMIERNGTDKPRVNGVGAILVGAIGLGRAEEVVAAASRDGGRPVAENPSLKGIDPRILEVVADEGRGCTKLGDLYRRLARIDIAAG